jgi:hypothetical protein
MARRALVAGALALLPVPAPEDAGPVRVVVPPSVEGDAPGRSTSPDVARLARVEHASADEGVARLCAGQADVALGPRPMTHDERVACARAGRPAFDLPIGYQVLAVVARADDAWLDALTTPELARAFTRAAEGEPTRAADVRAGWPDTPLRLAAPAPGSAARALLEELAVLPGGAREDATPIATAAELASIAGPALLALALLPPDGALPAGLRAVPVGGAPATPAAVRRHAYRDLARLVYAHAAAASVARPDAATLLAGMVDAPPDLVPLSDEARAFAHAGLAARAR